MKKRCFAALFALVMAAALGAQEGAGLLSASNLGNYSKPFLNGNGSSMSSKYLRAVANREDVVKITAFSGNTDAVDTPIEIALLSTCAGVVDIRPVMAPEIEAILPANNPKQADLKLGAAVYQEMQALRFLGNTNAVGRHEGIITFITDRGNVSRAEVEAYYNNGIRKLVSDIVDTEFKKTSGGYVPYNVYVSSGHGEVIEGIKDIIARFYIDPNANTYAAICAVANYFDDQLSRGFAFALHVAGAYDAVINLTPELMTKLNKDTSNRVAIPASVQNDPIVKKVTQNVTLKLD
jgi:hypothetical protein